MYPGMREANVGSMNFRSRKATVYGTKYAVSSSQQLATQVGMDILAKGGNAADAAVGVAAALAIVAGLSLEYLRGLYGEDAEMIPYDSVHAVTVPGAAAGWVDTVDNFGSHKLSLKEILSGAIDLAENGFPVSEIVSSNWKNQLHEIIAASNNHKELMVDGTRAPEQGEVFVNKNYAKILRQLAENGKDGYYKGEAARAIVKVLESRGGKMTLEDFEAHTSTIVDPISLEYKGYRVYECPPNGQGLVALEALGILNALERSGKLGKSVGEIEHNSFEYLHTLIECLRIGFADAMFHIGDQELSGFDSNTLLTKEYLEKQAEKFDMERKNDNLVHGYPMGTSDTVYFNVVDEEGNGCSFINSNYTGFGSCIIPEGCGFTLQNRASNFSLKTKGKNLYEGRKRPYHTIIPSLITKGDEFYGVFGVMGGFMQPQGHVQVFLNMIEFGMEPQVALDMPRFCIDSVENNVLIEDGISKEVVEKLEKSGHKIEYLTGKDRSAFGRGQIILRTENRGRTVLSAGCDPRSDGCSSAR
ncbi:hypothetical protein BB559_003839 [Furculomyces boomerangus]|uniref:Gamma-glutamyltransferase n=1 Tax=Furculomyces boomerangus TaxID=61424 RepID=A0A2T9YIE7_9FUNG|nr:hypothetical protein BB559_003839 [Furculomyces boomerangus]